MHTTMHNDAKVWAKTFEFKVSSKKMRLKNGMPKSEQVVTMKVRCRSTSNVVVCLLFVTLSSLFSQQHTKTNLLDKM